MARSIRPALLMLSMLAMTQAQPDPFFQNIPVASDDIMVKGAGATPLVPVAFRRARSLTMTHYGGPFEIDKNNNQKDPINSQMGGLLGAACGMGRLPRDQFPWWHAAAFNTKTDPLAANLPTEACGSCWRITCIDSDSDMCNKGFKSVVVIIADTCDPCNNSIDVNYNSATLISNTTRRHNADVRAERVMCPAAGSIQLRVTDYNGDNKWLRLNPNNVAGLGIVSNMTVKCGGIETPLVNKWGAVYEAGNVPGGSRCTVRMWQEDGDSIESGFIDFRTGCSTSNPCIHDTGVQFAGGAAPPPPNGCPQCVDIDYPDTTLGCTTLARRYDGALCDLPQIELPRPGAPWGYCARRCKRCPSNC